LNERSFIYQKVLSLSTIIFPELIKQWDFCFKKNIQVMQIWSQVANELFIIDNCNWEWVGL